MIIREIKKEELDGLIYLYTQLHDNKLPEKDDKLMKLWDKIVNDEDQHIIVAEEDGKLVSSCIAIIVPNLTHDQRPYAMVENVVTDMEYRNKGYTAAVLNYAKELAIKADCYKITLHTGQKSRSTMMFYEECGYNKNDKTAFIQWLE